MAVSKENDQFALVVSSNTTTSSYEGLLESQKELISKQISQLQNIVSTQCKLTGLNPLSQEMAAGALSIKIGKRPRDLLNPKAIKYMQSIFSLKDEISKKEIRAISALFGLTATQVRDFFTGQRSRVRRFIRLSKEKAIQSTERVEEQNGPSCSNLDLPVHPAPLNSMGPSNTEAPSCSMQDEILPGIDDSDKYFIANIFNLLLKEETFSGQVKLMEWILKIQNASVLYWFLTNGGVMILATWLSQAAIEEQTSVLHVILRVLCHLPLHKALPPHMSAILQSVNKLRFYRGSDISNRAKSLLSRWSKMFARSQAMRKPNATVSSVDAQNEMLLKQSIGEIMENESLESKIDTPGVTCSLQESFENSRNLGSSQSVKLLTAPSDDSNIKLLRGVSSHTRERRKVQLVEQPGQKVAGRSPQVTRVVSTTQGRPLSADDIQKAKQRAQFMRSKYGETYVGPQTKSLSLSKAHVQPKVEEHMSSASKASMSVSASDAHAQPKVEDHKTPPKLASGGETQEVRVRVRGKESLDSEEPVWKKCKRFQIPWTTPPEMKINKEWSVCCGENSKEVEVQNNRIKREKEVFYATEVEIPANPKEPWDQEMDYDDSLTPKIPTEQLPDDDNEDMVVAGETTSARENLDPAVTASYAAAAVAAIGGSTAENSTANMPEPDLELLAVLLKNPEIVFALTSGQGGSLTNEQTVKLLDAIKANGGGGNITNGFVEKKAEERVEVSLPSPTPSSDPVTSGWRPENAKNPFSGQNVMVNGEAYTIPGVYFQETRLSSPTPAAPSPTQQTILPAVQRRIDRSNIPAGGWSLPPQGVMTPPSSFAQEATSPRRHHRFTADRRNIPVDLAQEAISPPRHHRFSGDRRNIPVDLAQEAISPPRHQRFSGDRRNMPAVDRGHGPITPSETYFPSQPQLPEPHRLPAQSWTGRKSLGSSSYSLADHSTNHDAYGTREFVQPGPPWVRHRGYRDEPGFESWSPDRDRSPRRAHEHAAGTDIGYGRSDDYRRHETSRTPYNASRYRDRGGRDVNSRRRDRRR